MKPLVDGEEIAVQEGRRPLQDDHAVLADPVTVERRHPLSWQIFGERLVVVEA